MGKAIGVGGVFLKFNGDDQQLRDWYEEHLQIKMSPYGTSFIEGDQLTLVSFTRGDSPTTPSINFRVDNIDEVISHLRSIGCEITSDIAEYPYGKFAHFRDPFDNYIELWEPYEDEYRKMVQEEILAYQEKKSTT